MNLNNSASPLPPPNNPILDSYLNFRKATPFVTRTVLMSQLTCFFLSFLFDLTDAIANTPYFTVQHYEVYRIILSPFLCSRFISLVLAYFSFTENGRRLELSIGSTGFLVLIFTIGVLTNLIYILLAYTINAIIDSETSLFLPASGIWIILFGIISIECSQAPPQSMRKLFLFPVRATYYPLALFSVFTLLGIFEITSLISIGLGYAYGYVSFHFVSYCETFVRLTDPPIPLHVFLAKDIWKS
jgi:membrane associated rhomboid family serine protease